jgi:hypothetical protein
LKKEDKTAAITFVLAFVGSLAATVVILQFAYATAAIAPPANNQTNATLLTNQTIANVTASPLNVTITGTNAILNFDPTGFNSNLQVIGEVFNNGTEPINASIFVIPTAVYDANGTIVGVMITVPDASVIEKNNSSPFKVTYFDSDVKNGILNALFYKVQAANETAFGTVPPPPPLALGGGFVPGGPVVDGGGGGGGGIAPGGVPFGGIPGGPLMGPILPPPPTGPVLNRTLPNQTNPVTNQTEQPDESCLFDASQPKCAAVNDECPDGFNMNEDGNCFPEHSQCPSGYHSQEDDETGQCYPDSKDCDPGYIMDPDFPTCGKQEDICDKHPDLNQCTDFLAKQEAITSNDDNQTNTDNGQEQKEEEQGQGQTTESQQVQAGGSSITTTTTDQEQSQTVEKENGDNEEDN